MGCNCGKKTQDFKNLVQQAQVRSLTTSPTKSLTSQPVVVRHIGRDERIRLRAERMAQRSAGIESRRIAREARIKARQDAAAKAQNK